MSRRLARYGCGASPPITLIQNGFGLREFSAGACLAALAGVMGNRPDLEGAVGSAGFPGHVQAVTMGAGPADFLDLGGAIQNDAPLLVQLFGVTLAERADLARLTSPITRVRPGVPPFLIAHGTLDETVPIAQVRRFADALRTVGGKVDVIPIGGVYHNWTPQMEVAEGEERERDLGPLALPFFQKHLQP